MKSPRGPAAATMERAAPRAFAYTPAWTDRMHTAMGTFTTEEPAAAMPPPTNAMAEGERFVFRESVLHASP